MTTLTPMMQQYIDIKEKYKDCILFFRLGDFYEMFFEDAKLASKELEITLTGRDCGMEDRAPMCGVPFHSAENYIAKLVNKGYKVAICEQVEDPSVAKGLVKREVIRIITPGTVTEPSMLDEKKNNYLLSVYKDKFSFGLALVDISTGEFNTTSIKTGNIYAKFFDEIAKYAPTEIIVNNELYNEVNVISNIKKRFNIYISAFNDNYFAYNYTYNKIKEKFGQIELLKNDNDLSLIASGALLEYIEQTQKVSMNHIQHINIYSIDEFMMIDISTRRNLELTETIRDKSRKGSLLHVIDKTMTSMGARTLKKWIEQPLLNIEDIADRLDSVHEFVDKFMVRTEMRELLKRVYDIERLMGKVILGNANCRDLISLKNSLNQVPYIKDLMGNMTNRLNVCLYNFIEDMGNITDLIERSIIDDNPPVTIKEGGIIKTGYNAEVNRLRLATTEGKTWIAKLESTEREKTGIKNLKVGFNKVFGYYIEVTKSYYNLVPENFIRKQTLANCERYITQELKEIEDTILGAQDKIVDVEYQLFIEIRETIASYVSLIKNTAKGISEIDCLCSLAEVADRQQYCKPEVTSDGQINILDGRHPVVEMTMQDSSFVPNDTLLDLESNRLAIITGPNMAGKSTYMRQIALIVLMAQIGSFVPAKFAHIGLVDRIFTRVGASDDLASGQSTFMVEMSEVANILKNATPKSLLILDEIGRGTSTFDGLSIAWAVVEFICEREKLGCRSLFATHYHELTELEGKISGIKNYCISVKENGDDIIFLRKIIMGGADESYGIQVAKLAGVPQVVISRAKEILNELENADLTKYERKLKKKYTQVQGQINLFQNDDECNKNKSIIDDIKNIDVSNFTPIDALNYLHNLVSRINN